MYTINTKQWLDRPLEEVFEFFSAARNLELLTPDFLQFHVITPEPIVMKEGLLIDYRLKLRGIPIRWRSEIALWDPPFRFVDEQVKGPYRKWHHLHQFEEKDGGTLVTDEVHYQVWGGGLVNRFFVRPDVESIFAYREEKLNELFGTVAV